MSKNLRQIALAMSVLMVSSVFAGCSSNNNTSSGTETKKEEKKGGKEINVWSHLNETEVAELNKVAQEWAKSTGNTVKVIADKGDFQALIQAMQSSKGPDIVFGLPHDNLGTINKAGLLAEVPAGTLDASKYASQQVIDAVTINGKQIAVPVAQESIALFYNTSKVTEAPKTMDDLIAKGKEVGFKYNVNDAYFSYAFLAGNGGYVFKNNNGTLDPNDIGLGNEGAVKGFQFIQDLVQKHKLMSADVTGDTALAEFQAGKTGFYISGAWDLPGLKKANVPYAVAPMPTTNGNPTPTFLGIQSAFVNAKSKNVTEDWDLMKYLMDKSAQPLYKVGGRIPVLKTALESAEFKADKDSAAFAEQAKNANPMPNIPQVQAMWGPLGNNLKLLTANKQDAKTTGDNVVKQMKEGIAQQK